MIFLSAFSATVLFLFLLLCYVSFGITDMISDSYYKLNKIGNGKGNIFSITMFIVGLCMMICLLDTEQGVQPFAFGGGAGLLFVSVAPNFKEMDIRTVHKAGAVLSGLCCIGWCISVNWMPTILISLLYLIYLLRNGANTRIAKLFHLNNTAGLSHWLYWAEVAAFLDTFITYWLIY